MKLGLGVRASCTLGGLLALAAPTSLPLRAARAQAVRYQVGVSSSWGEKSAIICLESLPPRCGKGSISSRANRVSWGGGVAVVWPFTGPLRLETGALLANKGWEVTQPNGHALYVEFPVLARLGAWPGRRIPLGAAAVLGVAPALDVFHPWRVDLGLITGAELNARIGGALWSVAGRYTRGVNTNVFLQNRSLTVLIGYTPPYRR